MGTDVTRIDAPLDPKDAQFYGFGSFPAKIRLDGKTVIKNVP